jgi:hypothetical protein
MPNTHAIHGPTGGSRFGSMPVTKTGWAAGALSVLYVIGVAQYVSPIKVIGLGVPTVVGLLAGACGLFATLVGHDHSWVVSLAILVAVVAVALTLLTSDGADSEYG